MKIKRTWKKQLQYTRVIKLQGKIRKTKKYKRKKYAIEGQVKTVGKSNEQAQTQRKKEDRKDN